MVRRIGLTAILTCLLAACGSDSPASPSNSVNSAQALPTTTPIPAFTPLPDSNGCINGASFVEDLTIPDGTQTMPEDVLEKQWAVLNSGTCDWSVGYRLIRIDDGPIGAPSELALYPARAGEVGVWSVELKAPVQPGEQIASWQAQAPNGSFFGDQVFVLIEVVNSP